MSHPARVTIPPGLVARYSKETSGRRWLVSLPELIRNSLERWQLSVDLAPGALPWSGHGGMVLPVRDSDGSAAALKIAYPHDEALVERHALALWNGQGAVRLLAAHPASCTMLLERLDGDRSLSSEPMDLALEAWAALVPQLSIRPDGRPEWSEFIHVAAQAEQWSDTLPADWDQLGRPFPRWLLESALEVCQTRGAVGRRSGVDVLVHTDLHFLNILARDNSSATSNHTESFAAIDPQPMIGEPEFAVAPLLWNRLRDLPASDPEVGLLERCQHVSALAGLDADVARQWAIAREVDNALWYAANPGHQGDLARSLWVASTLAGRTLPGLPAAHALPEPGAAASESRGT